jgi:hypothetical protein
MGEIELHAVFPAGRAAKPAARVSVDYLIEEFARASGSDRRIRGAGREAPIRPANQLHSEI